MQVLSPPAFPRFMGAPVRFGDKAREQQYLAELRQLSPDGQMAIRELYDVATHNRPPMHVFWAQALAGKYAEIRDIVQTEFLSLQLKRWLYQQGDEAKIKQVQDKQQDFRNAAQTLVAEPEPKGHNYVPIEAIPEAEGQRFFDEFRRFLAKDIAQRPGVEDDFGMTF